MSITDINGFFLSMVKSIIVEKNQMTYLLTNNNNKSSKVYCISQF